MGTRLYRSRDDRMLAGVAGGLAELWDADPSLIRIVWALLVVLTGGVALVVYIVMAIVVPEEDELAPGRPLAAAGDASAPAPSSSAGNTTASGAGPAGWVPPGAAAPPGAAPPGSTPDWRRQRVADRDARREARRARRAARDPDGRIASIVIGGVLVLIGAFFLIREYLPTIDFDWFWPVALVALGVIVLLSAFRGESGPGGTS